MFSKPLAAHEQTAFAQENLLGARLINATRIREKFQDRVPVILVQHPNHSTEEEKKQNIFSRTKLIVPKDFSFGKFISTARLKFSNPIASTSALFFCLWSETRGYIIPQMTTSIGELDNEFRADDNLLYIYFCEENTFG